MTWPPRVGADAFGLAERSAPRFSRADIVDMAKTGRAHFRAQRRGVEIALETLAAAATRSASA